MIVSFHLNGRSVSKDVDPHRLCIEVLTDEYNCYSLRSQCRRMQWGSCFILVDNRPNLACIRPIFDLQSRDVWTIEGIAAREGFNDILAGFKESNALLCSNCAPARAIATESLLRHTLHPSTEEILEALTSTACDCTATPRILRAMRLSAEKRKRRLSAG